MTMSTIDGTADAVWEPAPYASYRKGLDAGEFTYQRCVACDHAFFYPRVLCPGCGSTRLSWETSAGLGVVYAVTWVSSREEEPYPVCLVDLDDGIRVMSTVTGADPASLAIGTRVRGNVETGDDEPRLVFCREIDDER